MAYIAVIGAGSWGTTLAALLAEKDYDVALWGFEREVVEEIKRTGINSTYLPDTILPHNLAATDSLEYSLKGARYVINVVPAQFTRSVFAQAKGYMGKDCIVVSASKGIEQKSLLTVSAILKELTFCKLAVLSGPSFAKEVSKKLPTAVTLASEDINAALVLQEIFNTNYFRVYTHNDVLGAELGGALKNVIAIASGTADGLGLGLNARAALITRGLAEIRRLGSAMGAKEETFSGLSGLGDLVLTCTGHLSRNYTVGIKLANGLNLTDILSQTKTVAEGVTTAGSAYELSIKFNVEMPIVEQVYRVIYENKKPADAVSDLMNRALKSEF